MKINPRTIDSKRSVNEYTHPESADETTIANFIESSTVFSFVDVDDSEILSLQLEGITNHRRIYDSLSRKKRREFNDGDESYNDTVDYPLVGGSTIFIPTDKIKINHQDNTNVTVTRTSFQRFFPEIFRDVSNSPGFTSASNKKSAQQLQSTHPQVTVWLWSREKYLNNQNSGFINITDDIISCDIDSGIDQGGSFSIMLQAISTEYKKDEGWIRGSNMHTNTTKVRDDRGKFAKTDGNEYERTPLFYDKIMAQNDMIFISYEKLSIDGNRVSDVADQWYDMIGLVDYITTSTSGATNDITLSVRGRDLTKALIEDNSYFNPFSIGHSNSLYGGNIGANGRFLEGDFKLLAAFLPKTIQQATEFVLNRITSIGYVPDDIFNQFNNLTTKQVASVTTDDVENIKGIWQLIKVFIDDDIQQLKIMDDGVTNPNGSILDIIKKFSQQPFVEFFTETYGDKFYLIFRRPPHTEQALLQIVDSIGSIVDDEVEDTRSLAERNSTFSEGVGANDLNEIVVDRGTQLPKVISVSELDVISDNLRMTNEAYSWYKVTNRSSFAGSEINLGTVPSIYFDEYAQVFGNRQLDITSNYSDYKFYESSETEEDQNRYADQTSQLLAYLVETNIYLPFTREGSITINGDRRIKKGTWIYYIPTNELFYVNSVSNSISIDSNIDRTTTLEVNRGMVLDYIEGAFPEGVDGIVSYFNIVNINKLQRQVYDVVSGGSSTDKFDFKSDMFVNSEVLQFFLSKRQFANEE